MKKFSIGILFLFTLLSQCLHAKIPVQQKTRLTEQWEFAAHDLGGVWEAVRPSRAGSPEAAVAWTKVTLPHCFNAEDGVDPDIKYYQGAGWYKTQLEVKNPYPQGRIMLEFEGAGQKTDVYIYTTKVGSHVGGYDSWNVDITEAVATFLNSKEAVRFAGKVPLTIRCDNTRDVELIPSDLSDFNVYGGIYRYLNLVYLPEVSVAALQIDPVLNESRNKGYLKVISSFYNPSDIREAEIQVRIKDHNETVVYNKQLNKTTPLGELCIADITLDKPGVWHVDTPTLYTCEVTIRANGQESITTERFGFRQFQFIEKGPFLLNGKRLLLRGTHRHEDHAGVGAAMTEAQMVEEMKMMKAMGINFIRLGHYQQSEIILNQCDELGILVWEEIPWCRGGLGGEQYRAQAKRMLTNMIQQHYNHPAVIIWGLGNENDWPNDFSTFEKSEIRAFMSELNVLSHQLDNSRKTAIRRCNFCSDIVDIYSPSIWAGWYRGNYVDYVKYTQEEMAKVKHFLHVEWGGDSHAGRHVETAEPSKNDWSETYIVKLIDWHLKEQENMPWLTGAAYWPFKDFSTPVRPDNPIPYVNQKGVIERDFTKKESYYVFQSYWTTAPMIYIYGHNRPVRWGEPNEPKEILVYSNCPEVELFVNGVSAGTKKRNSQDFPAAGLRWNVPLREGLNSVKALASRSKVPLYDEISFEYQTQKWGKEARLVLSTTPIGNDTIAINAQLVDDQGIRCLDSDRYIHFELSGDGELIQNQGTVLGSRKVQATNGRARIHMLTKKGNSIVAVKATGIPTAFIAINQKEEMQRIRENYIRALIPSDSSSVMLRNKLLSIPPETEISDQVIAELHQRYPLDTAKITAYIHQLQPNGSWPDINYADKRRSGWEPKRHAERVLEMIKQYSLDEKQPSPQLEEAIHCALNYWFTTKPTCRNWWQNQIGIPKTLGMGFLLFEHKMTPEEKKSAIEIMSHAKFGMTGQNKVWLAGNVMIRGLLQNDFDLVKSARDTIASEIRMSDTEGIKKDWCFHQHGPQQQFGNYGLAYLSGMSFYSGLFSGTSLAFDSQQLQILTSLVEQGYRWVLWNGYMDINALNRQLYHNAPIHKAFSLAFAATELASSDSQTPPHPVSPILSDNYQPHASGNPFVGHKHFSSSDYTLHRRPQWMASVKMASTRVIGTELVNEDNLKGYYMADGATYFYTRGDEYLNDFPFWDWRKVPGITSYETTAPLPRPSKDKGRNESAFVGGVTDGRYGLTAMELNRDGLKAHKAWVLTDHFVLCLGASIQSDTVLSVTTSIDQRMKRTDLLHLNGKQWETVLKEGRYPSTEEHRFFHDNTGYILSAGTECIVQSGARTGQWHDFMQMYRPQIEQKEMISLYLNHGATPKESTYQYIVLPASAPSKTADFDASSVQVLRNDAIAQVIALPQEGAYFIVAYQPIFLQLSKNLPFKAGKPGLYLLRKTGNGLKTYYEDPLRKR